jgi:hypothetical protein
VPAAEPELPLPDAAKAPQLAELWQRVERELAIVAGEIDALAAPVADVPMPEPRVPSKGPDAGFTAPAKPARVPVDSSAEPANAARQPPAPGLWAPYQETTARPQASNNPFPAPPAPAKPSAAGDLWTPRRSGSDTGPPPGQTPAAEPPQRREDAGAGPSVPGPATPAGTKDPAPAEAPATAPAETSAPTAAPAETSAPAAASASAGTQAAAAAPPSTTTQAASESKDKGAAAAADDQVTVVPGITRYHRSECILIRFLGPDDLQTLTRAEAEGSGCVPCKACQPEQAVTE